MFTVLQSQEFQHWLDSLRDRRAQVRIAARLRRAEAGNLGDWKSVGGEVSELRINFGPGYCTLLGAEAFWIVMLAGATSRRRRKTLDGHKRYLRNWNYE